MVAFGRVVQGNNRTWSLCGHSLFCRLVSLFIAELVPFNEDSYPRETIENQTQFRGVGSLIISRDWDTAVNKNNVQLGQITKISLLLRQETSPL